MKRVGRRGVLSVLKNATKALLFWMGSNNTNCVLCNVLCFPLVTLNWSILGFSILHAWYFSYSKNKGIFIFLLFNPTNSNYNIWNNEFWFGLVFIFNLMNLLCFLIKLYVIQLIYSISFVMMEHNYSLIFILLC
jgi:hypothetical protein